MRLELLNLMSVTWKKTVQPRIAVVVPSTDNTRLHLCKHEWHDGLLKGSALTPLTVA